MDKFYEQLLTTSKSAFYSVFTVLKYVLLVVGAAYLFLAGISFNIMIMIFAVASIGVSFLFGYFRDKQYSEYEYIFTNGNLQIDVIYNKKKRKTLLDEDVKNFENFGKRKVIKLEKGNEVINCIPWNKSGETYTIIASNKKAYVILPDEKLLKLINIYNIKGIRR